jgi:hypothetical protein
VSVCVNWVKIAISYWIIIYELFLLHSTRKLNSPLLDFIQVDVVIQAMQKKKNFNPLLIKLAFFLKLVKIQN